MNTKKVIVFGAGKTGEKFVYQNFNKVSIHCFWDNHKTGSFLGYQIEKPSGGRNYFIIVASIFYLEIREQLMRMGYHEFSDFIPVQIFKKKVAIAYGNCHMNAIKLYLECHREFSLEYGFYPLPMIQTLKNRKLEYEMIFKHCDLFFHQSIRKDNVYGKEYSSEQMLQYVSGRCRVISLPNLYGMPKYLFPQLEVHRRWQQGALCPFFIDSNVVAWLNNGVSKEIIINYIANGGVYTKDEILSMWEMFKLKLGKREQEWDIKISDYILENYKKERLFCDINHITSKMAREIAIRILEYMGYQEKILLELPIMDDMETVIYRDVKEALELEFEDDIIRKHSFGAVSLNNCEMSLDEYVDQLCQFTQFCIKRGVKD